MNFFLKKKVKKILMSVLCILLLASSITTTAFAAKDYRAEAEERKKLPVETNQYMDWPDGPQIGAQSAILMEVNTGSIV